VKSHALVVVVVGLLGNPVRIGELGIYRVAQAPNDTALNLIGEILRVQDPADLDGDKDSVDTNAARRIRDLDHFSRGHAERQREGDATPAILAKVASPVRHFTHLLENLAREFVPA